MKAKTWKLLAVILAAVIGVTAIGFGIFAIVKNNKTDEEAKTSVNATVMYLQDEYLSTDTMVYRLVVFGNESYTAVKYSIDNGAKTAIVSTTGAAKDNDQYSLLKTGDKYIDTGVETVTLTELTSGEHILKFYVYVDTTEYQVEFKNGLNVAKTYIFTVKDAA